MFIEADARTIDHACGQTSCLREGIRRNIDISRRQILLDDSYNREFHGASIHTQTNFVASLHIREKCDCILVEYGAICVRRLKPSSAQNFRPNKVAVGRSRTKQ